MQFAFFIINLQNFNNSTQQMCKKL